MAEPENGPFVKVHHDGTLELYGLELAPWASSGQVTIYTPGARNVRSDTCSWPSGVRVRPTPPK